MISQPPRLPQDFPQSWRRFFDEAVPLWVKNNYLPPRFLNKKNPSAFNDKDAWFFYPAVSELSELFTTERQDRFQKKMASYFTHPRFRSAYLLYFLPLQAAKFWTLFHLHPKAVESALRSPQTPETLKVVDVGSGPGTASFALLIWLLETQKQLPNVELFWIDSNKGITDNGKELVGAFVETFPQFKGKISLTIENQIAEESSVEEFQPDLILMGNVLNEIQLKGSTEKTSSAQKTLQSYLKSVGSGGILMVEPADKKSSQLLSFLRDSLFSKEFLEKQPSSIWGPCLHAGKCPLAIGRDWCHFSIFMEVPGKWFQHFSKKMGSIRQWLKFSYLWLNPRGETPYQVKPEDPNIRLVVSDLLGAAGQARSLLLCEPDQPFRMKVSRSFDPKYAKVQFPRRGDRMVKKSVRGTD